MPMSQYVKHAVLKKNKEGCKNLVKILLNYVTERISIYIVNATFYKDILELQLLQSPPEFAQ